MKRFALICAILLTSAWGQCAGSESGANDSDTRYLLFQLFSGDIRKIQEDIKSLDRMIKSGNPKEVIKFLDRIESRLWETKVSPV